MWWLWIFLAVLVALGLYLGVLHLLFYEDIRCDQVHQICTEDGAKVFLYRYLPEEETHCRPLILCHGLGASRYNFASPPWDWARKFAQKGWDVWVLELRGSGRSRPPKLWQWNFDDYLLDLKAALAYIQEKTGAQQVHGVGHSMGGLILYAYLATVEQRSICSIVTLGSPVRFLPETMHVFRYALKLSWMMHFLPLIPIRLFIRLIIPFFPYCSFLPVYKIHFHRENVDLKRLWKVTYNALYSLSIPLMRQFEYWARHNCFDSYDHKIDYQSLLPTITTPVLVISGEVDLMAHPQNVQYAYELLGGEKKLVHLARKEGFSSNYGHIDMVLSDRALEEVWPLVEQWLCEHDIPTQTGSAASRPSV